MGSTLALLSRTVRALRIAARDERIPRPLRWFAAFGLLPLPGPFDEVVLLLAAVPIVLFYRRPLADAWRQAKRACGADQESAEPRSSGSPSAPSGGA